jgi:hypothetical protein
MTNLAQPRTYLVSNFLGIIQCGIQLIETNGG